MMEISFCIYISYLLNVKSRLFVYFVTHAPDGFNRYVMTLAKFYPVAVSIVKKFLQADKPCNQLLVRFSLAQKLHKPYDGHAYVVLY